MLISTCHRGLRFFAFLANSFVFILIGLNVAGQPLHRLGWIAAVVGAVWLVATQVSPASATFHLMKIREIFPGTTAAPGAQYVMLQMYFAGQNLVSGHFIRVFDAGGATVATFTFAANVANGADQATILIATTDAQTLFGITADLLMTPVLPVTGGAVCFDVRR